MKKGLKRTITIVGSIAGAIILTIIILSVIIVKPLAPFVQNATSVSVVGGYDIGYNTMHDDQIKDKLDSVKFSVMRSLIEFNADYAIKPVKTMSDDEETHKKISSSSFTGIRPAQSQYFLEFSFGEIQTFDKFKDENGELIKFNKLILVINEASNSLQPVTIYPYLSGNIGRVMLDGDGYAITTPNEKGEVDSRYYYIYEFSAKMYTAPLYSFIEELGF